jgi:hypothetical protein
VHRASTGGVTAVTIAAPGLANFSEPELSIDDRGPVQEKLMSTNTRPPGGRLPSKGSNMLNATGYAKKHPFANLTRGRRVP